MDLLLSALKPLDAPGSIPVLILLLVIGVCLRFVWPRNRRLARGWIGGVLALYLTLALPVVANGIAARLPAVDAELLWGGEPIDSLIVFDGDNRRGRVAEARRIYELQKPEVVWLLGDAWMWDALWKSGIPYRAIQHIDTTPTTRAQTDWVRTFLSGNQARSALIIASRLQMPRVSALVEQAALDVKLVASPADDEPAVGGVRAFVPTYLALRISRDALYEHMAIGYYRTNGWIGTRQ